MHFERAHSEHELQLPVAVVAIKKRKWPARGPKLVPFSFNYDPRADRRVTNLTSAPSIQSAADGAAVVLSDGLNSQLDSGGGHGLHSSGVDDYDAVRTSSLNKLFFVRQ